MGNQFCIGVQQIHNYQKLQPISCGNQANVFKVKSLKTNKQYALKMFNKSQNCKKLKQFYADISVIKSKYIAQIIQCFQYRKMFCVVMELGQGQLWKKYIQLSEQAKKSIVKQIIKAVHFIHSYYIYHTDLKLQNIILFKNNRIKLIDFTQCKKVNYTAHQKTQCSGTNYYLAPEQLKQKQNTIKSDCWALGLILYQLQTKLRVNRLRVYKCEVNNEIQYIVKQPGQVQDFPNSNDLQKIKDLKMKQIISKLLVRDPLKRATAMQARRLIQNLDQTQQTTAFISIQNKQNFLQILQKTQKTITHLTINIPSSNQTINQLSNQIKQFTDLQILKVQLKNCINGINFKGLLVALKQLQNFRQLKIISIKPESNQLMTSRYQFKNKKIIRKSII